FAVSTETIRRDLDELEASGRVSRAHGIAAAQPFTSEPTLAERYRLHVAERQRIAIEAARTVQPGDVVMIDAGATTYHVARRLAAQGVDLLVVTNSHGLASALGANPAVAVVACPGRFHLSDAAVYGTATTEFIARYRANVAIIGASGLSRDGVYDASADAAAVKRAMIERAQRIVLVADASKFEQPAFERVCGLDAIDVVVTELEPPAALVEALALARVEIRVAR
ncbi:MAG: DeoR/GlpR transcriptional regulator, partial [Alphaproteobacteria bacterium]|nr:DeoR/GlpR transcriptional regulator [Alphaproteobacteria bacterium]